MSIGMQFQIGSDILWRGIIRNEKNLRWKSDGKNESKGDKNGRI